LSAENQIRILLTEDNPTDALYVKNQLKSNTLFKWEAVQSKKLADTIALLEKEQFDIVLLDLSLPDSTGLDTLVRLRDAHPTVSVVVLTGTDDESLGIRSVQAGAQDYLVKALVNSENLSRSILYGIQRNTLQIQLSTNAIDLEKSKKQLIRAQEIAKIGNFEIDPLTSTLNTSSQFFAVMEIEDLGSSVKVSEFLDHSYVNDKEEIISKINASVENREDANLEFRIDTESGQSKFVNVQLKYDKDDDKFLGTIQDITEFKKTKEDLKESEERYKTIFEQSDDAIYLTTNDGKFLEYNKSFVDLFGYEFEEFNIINAGDLYAENTERDIILEEISKNGSVRDREIKLKSKSGKILHCNLSATLLTTVDGTSIGYHGILRDITEKKRTEELIKAKELAERSSRIKEEFLAHMSHEIRTPMNVVIGMTQLLSDLSPTKKQAEYLNALKLSSDNLLRIINDILDFSKLEAGKLNLESRPFKLDEIIDKIFQQFKYKAQEKTISLNTHIDKKAEVILMGDPLRLTQVLTNLVSNSIKYTHKGYVSLDVSVLRETEVSLDLQFEVKDSGIGMSQSQMDKIFDSFTQASEDTTRKYGGTGLGLSITKNLIQLMDGSIEVDSTQGKGSNFKFKIKLPKNIKVYTDPNEVIHIEPLFDTAMPLRFLLTEDHKMNQIVASDLIKKMYPNVSITIANNGRECIDRLSEDYYDLVLMDVSMPEMNGLEASKHIRSKFSPPKSETPIIAMTAHAFSREAENCINAGMNEFVSKPINVDILNAKINKVLNENLGMIESSSSQNSEEVEEAKIDDSSLVSPNEIVGSTVSVLTDYTYLKSLSQDDNDTFTMLLETLLKDTPGEIVKLEEAHSSKDWEAIKAASHKLKSTVHYMGMADTNTALKIIEDESYQQKNYDTLEERIKEIRIEIEAGLIECAAELEKYKVNV